MSVCGHCGMRDDILDQITHLIKMARRRQSSHAYTEAQDAALDEYISRMMEARVQIGMAGDAWRKLLKACAAPSDEVKR